MEIDMLVRYKLSPEEQRVLRECNRESFWYRSVPIGGFLSSVAYAGVKYGVLNPNARFGPAPKMIGAALAGYFIGKISYQPTCAEKMMQLPNSQLGEYLRKQTGTFWLGGFQEASVEFAVPHTFGFLTTWVQEVEKILQVPSVRQQDS